MGQWQLVGILDFRQHEAGADALYTRQRGEYVHHQVFEGVAIGHDHLHQIVELAGEVMALQHLGHGGHLAAEIGNQFGRMQAQGDLHEADQIQSELLMIKQGDIGTDQALLLQAPHPCVGSGCGKPDALAKLGVRQAASLLQEAEKINVGVVEFVLHDTILSIIT